MGQVSDDTESSRGREFRNSLCPIGGVGYDWCQAQSISSRHERYGRRQLSLKSFCFCRRRNCNNFLCRFFVKGTILQSVVNRIAVAVAVANTYRRRLSLAAGAEARCRSVTARCRQRR